MVNFMLLAKRRAKGEGGEGEEWGGRYDMSGRGGGWGGSGAGDFFSGAGFLP